MLQKLHPFFPALEHAQSVNLRDALYRRLNELRKEGVFGREAILRKTMLEDCRGAKFEEILFLFSSAVLRKVLLSKNDRRQHANAIQLSTAFNPDLQDRTVMRLLTIVYRSSLSAFLRDKQDRRLAYRAANEGLYYKTLQIRRRYSQATATLKSVPTSSAQMTEESRVKRRLQKSWVGNVRWLKVVLYGDEEQVADSSLGLPFERVWGCVQNHEPLPDGSPAAGLHQQLRLKVKQQQDRLQRWKEFQGRMQSSSFSTQEVGPATKTQQKAATNSSDREVTIKKSATSDSSTARDPSHLNVQTSQKQRRHGRSGQNFPRTPVSAREGPRARSTVGMSDLKPLDLNSLAHAGVPKQRMANLSQSSDAAIATPCRRPFQPHSLSSTNDEPLVSGSIGDHDRRLRNNDVTTLKKFDAVNNDCDLEIAHEETAYEKAHEGSLAVDDAAAAEQILLSISNTSPSPIKMDRPSLLERTRMSMAGLNINGSQQRLELPIQTVGPETPSRTMLPDIPAYRVDLQERTRQSLSRIPSTQARSRTSVVNTKPRTSQFPINQFETPAKQQRSADTKSESTPPESLFAEDAEYASVFKSRPRIAVSPVLSPVDGGHSQEGLGTDLNGNVSMNNLNDTLFGRSFIE